MKRRDALLALAGSAALAALAGLAGCAGSMGKSGPAREPLPEGSGILSFIPNAPYVPTRPELVDALLALAGVGPRDNVYDLGCGDGRIVIAAAQLRGARGVGVDIDFDLISLAQAHASGAGVAERVRFVSGDLFQLDLREATVVTLYLSVALNQKLLPKLLQELPVGARIVANRFGMGDAWAPEKTVQVGDTPLYLWTVPAGRKVPARP
ncbi:MAG: class I SAM-dependent methyltransferase [Betaproteobacteria bacterium]|nr:class I SAM-dependent methyltransferase [Betaproteobacteria bacterium]